MKRIATVLGLVAMLAVPAHADPDLRGKSVKIDVKRGTREDEGPLLPVSMTRIGRDRYLVANYRNIYNLDLATRAMVPVDVAGKPDIWAPTALAYSPFYELLFIANYTGGDVLVARTGDSGIEIEQRITDHLKGPEGVAVSRGGRFMAVADYLGNQVVLFERVNEAWVYRWARPVIAAHGVAITDDAVFAGGEAVIAKFDLQGNEAGRAAMPVQFATCINEDSATGGLIGSDTSAGRVFTMSANLVPTSSFGANGPGHSNLSMPYCAYREGNALWVLSTYQDRLIRVEDGQTTSFDLGAPSWAYVDEDMLRDTATMWHGATKFDHPLYDLLGKQVSPSYGSLHATDGSHLIMPTGGWPYYVTTIASAGEWLAIAANSSPKSVIYNRTTGALGTADIEWDCWAIAARILCPARSYTPAELGARMTPLSEAKGPTGSLLDLWQSRKTAADR